MNQKSEIDAQIEEIVDNEQLLYQHSIGERYQLAREQYWQNRAVSHALECKRLRAEIELLQKQIEGNTEASVNESDVEPSEAEGDTGLFEMPEVV